MRARAMAKKFVLAELNETHPLVVEIKELLEKSTRQKVAITLVDKMLKKAGVATKKVTFNFEEGQSISLVLRTDGDVIQHLLNNKNIPLSKVMDLDKRSDFNAGLEDLALKLKGNQDKFSIKRMAARVVIPKAKAPALTVKKRIQQARETLAEINQMLKEKREHLNLKQQELKVANGDLS
ncbi:hypothetical protein F965_00094 [Acinetobacter schindleri NIPH 900]|uniref:Defence against restriction A N-terminal domain-containing protein n=2 Tax=Acinetobacter schindleri TaxID=108981 RepID=N8Y553_9GAMM|nr:hypothetical protein F965_00094 [Acinetobacter schindleri NIPH 900]